MADLILSAVGFILELSELEDIHLKSYERAQSNQSMAIYTAKLLYNDAFANVPASDHPRMKGPVDLSEKKHVKAYKGLTAECEEEVYNMLCNVGQMATLEPVATALNNYYESHGYGRPWQGQRLKRWAETYRLARERITRENGEKGAGLRENRREGIGIIIIPEVARSINRYQDPRTT
jgi:hypothetical protein